MWKLLKQKKTTSPDGPLADKKSNESSMKMKRSFTSDSNFQSATQPDKKVKTLSLEITPKKKQLSTSMSLSLMRSSSKSPRETSPFKSTSVSNLQQSSTRRVSSPKHFAVGRNYIRRKAVVQQDDSIFNKMCTMSFFDGEMLMKEIFVKLDENQTLKELLTSMLTKQELTSKDLTQYSITAMDNGNECAVDFAAPSTDYEGCNIDIKVKSNNVSFAMSSESIDQMSIESCLSYFDQHGLIEAPSLRYRDDDSDDDEILQLPRVDPIESIESCWEELPIEPHIKANLSSSQLAQQQAIWELIATEHSFLRQLEVIINLFMRALELIRRQDLLTEVNYHNIFGYMEEIYTAHEQFWSWTLQPCLEKTQMENCLLDINEILIRFPSEFSSHFEIYEQHCAFETTNLRSLDDAFQNSADFRTYVEWCESHLECQRLKLKDFLAKPMQRLTKYKLLFNAVLKKTTDICNIEELKKVMEDVATFVDSVNSVLKAQAETSRIENIMKKIVGYTPVEVPGELKDLIQPHTHLDLMAPMPDVDITKPRILILEGKLKFRDSKDKVVAHVFLFSDMLLITKTIGKHHENYTIIRAPYKISNIQTELRGGVIHCIVLNEFRVYTTFFTLKANSPAIAKEWVDHIGSAQDYYNLAITKKTPGFQIFDCLRQERILHGISMENMLPDSEQKHSAGPSPILAAAGIGFRRVASNDSTLSSSSCSAFPFEMSFLVSPRERRKTLPVNRNFLDTPNRNYRSNSVKSVNFNSTSANLTSPPDNSQNYSLTPPLRKTSSRQRTALRQFVDTGTQTTEHPDKELSDEDSDVSLPSPTNTSPVERHSPPPQGIIKKHKRNKSHPTNITFSTSYILDTMGDLDTPNEDSDYPARYNSFSSSSDRSSFSFSDCDTSYGHGGGNSSLMNEIIDELCKTKSDLCQQFEKEEEKIDQPADHQNELFLAPVTRQRSKSLYSNQGNRLNMRRSAIHLSNILESFDENDDMMGNYNMSLFFNRNNRLRRSRSSFELSFHRKIKPPSPLVNHFRRSTEQIPEIIKTSDEEEMAAKEKKKRWLFGRKNKSFDGKWSFKDLLKNSKTASIDVGLDAIGKTQRSNSDTLALPRRKSLSSSLLNGVETHNDDDDDKTDSIRPRSKSVAGHRSHKIMVVISANDNAH
jgi:pleckstrin domain-containing family G protein 5